MDRGISGEETMGRALHRLGAVAVNKLGPGMHNDGHGLYLRVSETGTRSWIFRFTLGGKTRDMGLGGTAVVSLASARKRAQELRELRQRGIDPISHQQASMAAARVVQAKSVSFREAAERYIASHEATWTRKHHADWVGTMRDYVFPLLGVLPVSVVDTSLVMQVLEPLWRNKTETGSRVRGRIEAVLDWARVAGLRDGQNPAAWKGHLAHMLPRRSQVRPTEHYKALDYREVPEFMSKLRGDSSMNARLLEFVILTAVRLGEGRGTTWDEIDLVAATWTVPADRMKMSRPHRVPLSSAAVTLLRDLLAIRRGDAVFPGRDFGRAAGATATRALVRQLTGQPITIHGFRSSFRDWAGEQTDYPREVAELALAHSVGSDVERAYARTDLFDRRRLLMQAWADYCIIKAGR
jgi:integrase